METKNIIIAEFNADRDGNLYTIEENHFNTTLSLQEFTKSVMLEMVKPENFIIYTEKKAVSPVMGFDNFIEKMCFNVKFRGDNYAGGASQDIVESAAQRARATFLA